MLNDADFRLARAAMQTGSVSDVQILQGLLGERTLSDFLIGSGVLSADDVLDMMAEAKPMEREEIGRYRLLEEIGVGGMGTVYKAFDRSLKRFVALKLLQRSGAEDIARFRREAETVAGLDHPGIVKLYEFGDEGGLHYLAMQLIHGRPASLHELTPRRAAEVVRDAARAVGFAHARGIIHRDLKPSNLMIDETGHVVVMDFGLARAHTADSSLSATGAVIGTPVYMAPEQARGESRSLDARVDVYGLGATLYHLASKRTPFAHPNVYEILEKVVREEPPTIRSFNPGVHMDLQTIVAKAMEKERERRYPSAEALADDLHRYLDGEPISARRIGLVTRTVKRIRRRPWVSGAIAASGLLVAALVSIPVVLKLQAAREVQERAELLDAINRINLIALKIERWDQNYYLTDVDLQTRYPELQRILSELEAERARLPDLYEADYHQARALSRLGRPDEALQRLDAALSAYERRRSGIASDLLLGALLYERGVILHEQAAQRRSLYRQHEMRFPDAERALDEQSRRASEDLARARSSGGMTPQQAAVAAVVEALARGRPEEAVGDANDDPMLLAARARALAELGRDEDALASIDRAILLRRNDPGLWVVRGSIEGARAPTAERADAIRLWQGVERSASEGLELDSGSVELRVQRITALTSLIDLLDSDEAGWTTQFERIRSELDKLLAAGRNDPLAHLMAGAAFRARQRHLLASGRWEEGLRAGDEAIGHLNRAAALDPFDPFPEMYRALVHGERGTFSYGERDGWIVEIDAGIRILRALIDRGGETFGVLHLLRILQFHRGAYRDESHPQEARADLEACIRVADAQERLRPDSIDPLVERGGAYVMLGDIKRRAGEPFEAEFRLAVADLERFLAGQPDEAHAWRYLGRAYHRLGRPREALTAWDRMAELQPTYMKWVQEQYDEARREVGDQ